MGQGPFANRSTGRGVPASVNNAGEQLVVGPDNTITVIIANGVALTDVIDLKQNIITAIQIPAAWTAANLTFQASSTRTGTFADVFDAAGNELTAVAAASRVIVDLLELSPIRFLKIRSGTTGTPVNQGAERTLNLILNG